MRISDWSSDVCSSDLQDRDRKQQRAEKAAAVADMSVIEAKLHTALAARADPETFIIGRTDAYGPLGLDAAMRRAERFLSLGVDGVFVAGLKTEEDYRRVGAAFAGAFVSAAMFEGGDRSEENTSETPS